MTSYGYIIVGLCIISFNLNCIMQLKQFYNIATKVSSRKKCYYFWWSTWLIMDRFVSRIFIGPIPCNQMYSFSPICLQLVDVYLIPVSVNYLGNHSFPTWCRFDIYLSAHKTVYACQCLGYTMYCTEFEYNRVLWVNILARIWWNKK